MRRILAFCCLAALPALGQEGPAEADLAVRKLRPAPGLKVSLFAAEPQLQNPVAFSQDEKGRWFVVETFRRRTSVLDIRTVIGWLDEDLASRSVEDRIAMHRRHLGTDADKLAVESERVRRVEDTDGDGRADRSTVFADGFNTLADGVAAGVVARGGKVWFAALPNLWQLEDRDGDGQAEARRSLQYGWGIRNSYGGHDFHGLIFGPDGRLYLSVGDRGCRIESEGRVVTLFEEGGVLRCNPDGSQLEIFARGLRNPQELAFDDEGNLWTVDNNANIGPDNGETGRVTCVVEGADYGWRIGYQHLPDGGPWIREGLWAGKAAYQLPPAGHLTHGPSGLAADPRDGARFLVCDFPGGVHSFRVKPEGAGFVLADSGRFLWELYATDVAFGLDGAVYVLDWVQGFEKSGKGRIFRVAGPGAAVEPSVARLFAEGHASRSVEELAGLLGHGDRRVRQEAQFELVERRAGKTLSQAARRGIGPARRHGLWGLQQLREAAPLLELLADPEAEIRALAAKALGDVRSADAPELLIKVLKDPQPRVRAQAALALGRLGCGRAAGALLELLRENGDRDVFLRHAGVSGLAGAGDIEALVNARKDPSASVRRAAVLALRRLARPELALFLDDAPVALEAARAIHDMPVPEAFPALAARLEAPEGDPGLLLRAVNAAARLGRSDVLARTAAEAGRPVDVRRAALKALADFASPPGRDRVLGLWRPSPPGDPEKAREALSSVLESCLVSGPEALQVEALKAGAALGAGDTATFRKMARADHPSSVRAEALRGLALRKAEGLGAALRAALGDPDEALRREVLGLLPKAGLGDGVALLEQAAREGAPGIRQAALLALGDCGSEADAVFGRLLDLRLAGDWPAAAGLELIETSAKRLDPGVRERLAKIEAARSRDDALAAWEDSLEGGDPQKGSQLFWVRAHASCKQCHVVGAEGGTAGPALTGIGARKSRRELLEAMLLPSKTITPGFESVALLLDSEAVETGVVLRESAAELVLRGADGAEQTVPKARIKSARRGLSAMPDDLGRLLTKRELRDLVAYLAGLR